MIPWTTVNVALKQWFSLGTGLDLVVMENEPRPFSEERWGRMQVMSTTRVGTDSVDTENGRTVIRGFREFALSVAIESSDQDVLAEAELARLAAVYSVESMRRILAAVNVAVATFGQATMGDVLVDDRWISVWKVDVEFNAAFEHVMATDEQGGIDSVSVYGALPLGTVTRETDVP